MQWLIKKTLLASLVLWVLGSSFSQAAPKPGPQSPKLQAAATLDCASQGVLENLAALIIKSNQLDPSLNFRFSNVRLDPSKAMQAALADKNRACLAHLQIVREKPDKVVDELEVAYNIVSNPDGTFGLAFTPMRQTP